MRINLYHFQFWNIHITKGILQHNQWISKYHPINKLEVIYRMNGDCWLVNRKSMIWTEKNPSISNVVIVTFLGIQLSLISPKNCTPIIMCSFNFWKASSKYTSFNKFMSALILYLYHIYGENSLLLDDVWVCAFVLREKTRKWKIDQLLNSIQKCVNKFVKSVFSFEQIISLSSVIIASKC